MFVKSTLRFSLRDKLFCEGLHHLAVILRPFRPAISCKAHGFNRGLQENKHGITVLTVCRVFPTYDHHSIRGIRVILPTVVGRDSDNIFSSYSGARSVLNTAKIGGQRPQDRWSKSGDFDQQGICLLSEPCLPRQVEFSWFRWFTWFWLKGNLFFVWTLPAAAGRIIVI